MDWPEPGIGPLVDARSDDDREGPVEHHVPAVEQAPTPYLGLALADMTTAIRVYHRAKASGIGRELPL